jgi:hypothetical protein
MGMANKAPDARYVRRFNITSHALDRFRERVDEDVKARSNFDVGNLLDEKVRQATYVQTVRDPHAPELITKLHEIEVRSGTYYAVVREDAVVTVLDEEMVKTNFKMANWKPALNSPFTRETLSAVQPVPSAARKPSPTLASTPPPVPVQSPLEATGIAYAQALKYKHDCEQAYERAKSGVKQAEAALQVADEQLADLTKTLMNLATGQPPKTA